MQYFLTTPPVLKPLTIAELKEHLRVTFDTDDAYILALQDAAVLAIEDFTNKQLLTATWTLLLDKFPSIIEIDRLPVASIISLKYYDTSNDIQEIDAADYVKELRTTPATLQPKVDESWPDTIAKINAVEVVFVAGYATAAAVLDVYKHAIKLIVGNLYTFRHDIQQKPNMTKASKLLLEPYTKSVI